MGKALFFYGFKPHFGACLKEFVLRILLLFVNFCWVSLRSCIFCVSAYTFRKFLSPAKIGCEKPDEGSDQSGEGELPKLDYEVKSVSNMATSKYQFNSGSSFCSIVEEPETMNFSVQEMFVMSNDECISGQDFPETHKAAENDFLGESVDLNNVECSDHVVFDSNSSELVDSFELNGDVVVTKGKAESYDLSFKEKNALSFTQLYFCEKEEAVNAEHKDLGKHEFYDQTFSSLPNSDDFWAVIHKFDDFCGDFDSDETGCDTSPDGAVNSEAPMSLGGKIWDFYEDSPSSLCDAAFDESILVDVNGETQYECFNSQFFLQDPHGHHLASNTEEHTSRDVFSESDDESDKANSILDDYNDVYTKEVCDEEDDQTDELDVLLEQKELIRQMKKEMRRLKSGGLPIILEESESPKFEEDLRPLMINEKIGRKDVMDEIQTIYKGYLDKMRKLDILSQQTMYAIGLLQLKDQVVFASNNKISVPIIQSLLAQNFWSYRLRKQEGDAVEKMIKYCLRDLEFVYINQLCLSWEILKWQHHKAKELEAYDPDCFHQHNQVAGEFQKFQRLLRRVTQDERFHQRPRVERYVKSRCDLPELLQVPLIKDDPNSEWRGKGEDVISIQVLKEVIGASMSAFWEFLRADKDDFREKTLMGVHDVTLDIIDPLDMELIKEIQSNLEKKEKKIKEVGRSGNRIVKKFQKQQDQCASNEIVIAQVELCLISRVLHMPRLTSDQFLWCHRKLSKINVIGRKVHIESSFLLFPC